MKDCEVYAPSQEILNYYQKYTSGIDNRRAYSDYYKGYGSSDISALMFRMKLEGKTFYNVWSNYKVMYYKLRYVKECKIFPFYIIHKTHLPYQFIKRSLKGILEFIGNGSKLVCKDRRIERLLKSLGFIRDDGFWIKEIEKKGIGIH